MSVCGLSHRAAHAVREPPGKVLACGRGSSVKNEATGPVGDGFGEFFGYIFPVQIVESRRYYDPKVIDGVLVVAL